ncbi:hypothetical protein BOX15_Mlig003863g1 [Macrostomum lignano]|uniref:Uncharacterized protein n=1 Tax=Macrostomum lignano TaxID=282301 RepID=A0A267ET15_9PLAT|nr:hypothetical protein BOX15_Mlig003863g1 [Macrostomum lignano]
MADDVSKFINPKLIKMLRSRRAAAKQCGYNYLLRPRHPSLVEHTNQMKLVAATQAAAANEAVLRRPPQMYLSEVKYSQVMKWLSDCSRANVSPATSSSKSRKVLARNSNGNSRKKPRQKSRSRMLVARGVRARNCPACMETDLTRHHGYKRRGDEAGFNDGQHRRRGQGVTAAVIDEHQRVKTAVCMRLRASLASLFKNPWI